MQSSMGRRSRSSLAGYDVQREDEVSGKWICNEVMVDDPSNTNSTTAPPVHDYLDGLLALPAWREWAGFFSQVVSSKSQI